MPRGRRRKSETTPKIECLDRFTIVAERHLNHIVSEFVRLYHECRPQQALQNMPPAASGTPPASDSVQLDNIVCHERLGRLLKHYERRAACRLIIQTRTALPIRAHRAAAPAWCLKTFHRMAGTRRCRQCRCAR